MPTVLLIYKMISGRCLVSFANKLGCAPLVHQAGLSLQWCVGLELSLGHNAWLYWAENSALIIQNILIILRLHGTNIIPSCYIYPLRLKPALFLLKILYLFLYLFKNLFRLNTLRIYFLPFFIYCSSCFLTFGFLSSENALSCRTSKNARSKRLSGSTRD